MLAGEDEQVIGEEGEFSPFHVVRSALLQRSHYGVDCISVGLSGNVRKGLKLLQRAVQHGGDPLGLERSQLMHAFLELCERWGGLRGGSEKL